MRGPGPESVDLVARREQRRLDPIHGEFIDSLAFGRRNAHCLKGWRLARMTDVISELLSLPPRIGPFGGSDVYPKGKPTGKTH
jgi:hypothetical protein